MIMKKKLKVSFRTFGKIGFLLVVIGFFLPISSVGIGKLQLSGNNGFDLAKALNRGDDTLLAILVYVVFAAAIAGVLVGALLFLKNKIKVYVDWVCLLACIGSGLIVYLPKLDDNITKLQTGGYIILIGWVIALAAQIISRVNKES
jgi:hypothetical protein